MAEVLAGPVVVVCMSTLCSAGFSVSDGTQGLLFSVFSYGVPDVGIEPTDGFSVAERREQGEGKDPVQPFPALWPFRGVCFFWSGQVFSFRHAAGRSLSMRVLSRSVTRRSIKSSDVSYGSGAWMSWSDSDSSSP